jgi:hypothetical protein
LITSLTTPELNLGDLLILLKIFYKTAVAVNNVADIQADALVTLLQEMISCFDLATGKSMKLLWNYFRPSTLSTERHFDVERSIFDVVSSISYFTADKSGKLPMLDHYAFDCDVNISL